MREAALALWPRKAALLRENPKHYDHSEFRKTNKQTIVIKNNEI